LRDPEVHGICIMHAQAEDKVDAEFLEACNPNLKVISTFSVGFGELCRERELCRGFG
jgi:glyoxylate/hydroxypyruvate reductase